MLVLGIETSCDETAAAIVDSKFSVLSNVVYSQQEHAPYGGVVPELASRAHIRNVVPVVRRALEEAKIDLDQVDGIAVTQGPGLMGSLIVGVSAAKGIALSLKKPLIGIHHLEGHIFSARIGSDLKPPFLALLVSGGHTQLVLVQNWGQYHIYGQTRDDAAGEAFDKVAKLLDLLPGGGVVMGGKRVSDCALKGDPASIRFPRALLRDKGYDFSFSGLKTAVLQHVRQFDQAELSRRVADIAASFEQAVVDVLVEKTERLMDDKTIGTVALVGGVAANKVLRHLLKQSVENRGGSFYCPQLSLCTDNAAMIAAVGVHYMSFGVSSDFSFDAEPRMRL